MGNSDGASEKDGGEVWAQRGGGREKKVKGERQGGMRS